MRKLWATGMGIVLSGLLFIGVRRLVNANHGKEDTATKLDMSSMVFLIIVVVLILMLAFSNEIKTFLTHLLSK